MGVKWVERINRCTHFFARNERKNDPLAGMQCTTLLILLAWPLVPPWLWRCSSVDWDEYQVAWVSPRHHLASPPPTTEGSLAGPWVPRVPIPKQAVWPRCPQRAWQLWDQQTYFGCKLCLAGGAGFHPTSLIPTDLLPISSASPGAPVPRHSDCPIKKGIGGEKVCLLST